MKPRDALVVILEFENSIAEIARYGDQGSGGYAQAGPGNFGDSDPTGNAAIRNGPARKWLNKWEQTQKDLNELAKSALIVGPPKNLPMCEICGHKIIGEVKRHEGKICHNGCRRKLRGRTSKVSG